MGAEEAAAGEKEESESEARYRRIPEGTYAGDGELELEVEAAVKREKSDGELELELEAGYRMDGGRCWAVLLSGHLCMAVVMGLVQSFGIFVKTLAVVFEVGQGTTTLAAALIMTTLAASSIVGTAFYNVTGCRLTMWLGGATAGLGLASAAFAQSIWPMVASLCVVGTGFGVLVNGLISAQSEYFVVLRRMAQGLCSAGASVGSLSMPNFFVWAVPSLGWRSTFFVYSGLASVFLIGGAVARSRCPKRFRLRRTEVVRFSLLRRLDFVFVVFQGFCFGGSLGIVLFFVNYSMAERGMDDGDTRYVLMACGIANFAARMITSFFMATMKANFPLLPWSTTACVLWTLGILSFSWPRELAGSAMTGILIGLGFGGMMSPMPPTLEFLFGPRRLPSCLGIIGLAVGVGSGGMALVAGHIASHHTTAAAIYLLAAIGALSTASYAIVTFRNCRRTHKAPIAPQDPADTQASQDDSLITPVTELVPSVTETTQDTAPEVTETTQDAAHKATSTASSYSTCSTALPEAEPFAAPSALTPDKTARSLSPGLTQASSRRPVLPAGGPARGSPASSLLRPRPSARFLLRPRPDLLPRPHPTQSLGRHSGGPSDSPTSPDSGSPAGSSSPSPSGSPSP